MTASSAPDSHPSASAEGWARQVRDGDRRAASRLIRALEDDEPGARAVLSALVKDGARPRVIGITGPAGAGKSTLVDALVAFHRARGEKVGVVAVDPSSPFSGGAVLGDRIRMQRHATDAGVFVRSLATRGAVGGLARAAWDAAAVLGAAGFPIVYLETTGAGQADVDVAAVADLVAVVCVPGLGDDVQTLKAGILEIADVLVVNKGDREGAERTVHELEAMVALRHGVSSTTDPVFVMKTTASTGEGVAALAEAFGGLVQAAAEGPAALRRGLRARALLLDALAFEARKRAALLLDADPQRGGLVASVAARDRDPVSAARELLDRLLRGDTISG